jgi:hypothetical protein
MNHFRNCVLIIGIILLATSCKKDKEEAIAPLNDNSLPSGAVANITLLQKNNNTMRIGLDVIVFRDSKNIETGLGHENFSIDTLRYRGTTAFTLDGAGKKAAKNPEAYSALMLMDQSGSINSSDRTDLRLDAAKAFSSNLGSGNEILLWSFSGSNYMAHGTAFSADTAMINTQIESLRNQEGGGTPLYFSQHAATGYCTANAHKPGKAVLTFTDGKDTRGDYTAMEVAENALSKNVRLYNVGLGSAETDMLCRQAVASGGAFMFAKDARQLISMFGNLGKLLDQSAMFYHTEWTVTKDSDFPSSGTLSHELKIKLSYGDVAIPFSVDY